MRINHVTLRREMEAQRWRVTDLANEIGESRTHLSNIVNGNRPATFEILAKLAEALRMNPYGLLGPDNPKAAVLELVQGYGITAADVAALEQPRHPEQAAA